MGTHHGNSRALIRWQLILLLALALLITANVFVGRYGQQVRDSRPEKHLAIAEDALNRGDYPGALQAWDDAYERGPQSPLVHKVFGDIHHRMENWKQSVNAYEKTLEIGTDSVGVRLNLMTALIELKQYQKVTDVGERFVKGGFENPYFARYIATAYFRAKHYDDAISWFRIALDSAPNNLYLLEQLMQSYERSGKDKFAQKTRDKIDAVQLRLKGAGLDTQP